MSARKSSVPQKCLACNVELTSPIVCQGCHKLYPMPQSVDYFGLLGLQRCYDIDPQTLGARFVALSRHVHPDFFTSAGEEMGHLSTRLSAELNEAIKVLQDPVLRAGYLLETSGGTSAAEDRSVPAEILREAMTLREKIQEARDAGDDTALQALRKQVDEKRSQLLESIAALARKLPTASDEEKSMLRQTINSVKYYNNMGDLLWTV